MSGGAFDPGATFAVRPIGWVRSPFVEKVQAPRQPRAAEGVRGSIELVERIDGRALEDAVSDLDGWDYIWVVFWFHRNAEHGWRPKVLPPRSTQKRGVFATRSPHRPNPIGLSVLRLLAVEGRVLEVADLDLLDGTPVLDVKPYVPWTDAITDAKTGWLEHEQRRASTDVARPDDPLDAWIVEIAPLAGEQLAFLATHGIALAEPARATLRLGPKPHAYRRIRPLPDGGGVLAIKDFRLRFSVHSRTIVIESVRSGYRPDQLASDPSLALHAAFDARWPRA
jgi:tRNA-Thr(GGU) m(6)t(6)A37 methyltransferase TsaA